MPPSFRPQKPVPLIVVLIAFLAAGLLSVLLMDSGSVATRASELVNDPNAAADKKTEGGASEKSEGKSEGKGASGIENDEVLAPVVIPQEAVHLKVRGVVGSGRTSELSSNVSGLVEWVNPAFREGSEIKAGEPLVRVGKQFYAAELADAKANLEDAKVAQAEEQGEALKAVRKWDSNPKAKGERSELVMRVPYRRAATAHVAAAEARVAQAERLIENTEISAPYDCVVASKMVDLGMRISEGDLLGCLFSAKEREIRIPLSLEKLGALPRDEKGQVYSIGTVYLNVAGKVLQWNAQIVRISPQADAKTQEVAVIAVIDENPSYPAEFRMPPLNLELNADFQAQTTDALFWVPASSMSGDSELWVVTEAGELAKRPVSIEQSDGDRRLVVAFGKLPGDRVCLKVPAGARPGARLVPLPPAK